jgi:protein ImuB
VPEREAARSVDTRPSDADAGQSGGGKAAASPDGAAGAQGAFPGDAGAGSSGSGERSAADAQQAARLVVVWCPDWPVTAACVAAGVPLHHPAAVFAANRVVACSAVARRNGVRRGMRRREAQASCPELAVLAVDPARDARLFEPVAAAVEELVVGVDVVRPGVVAAPVDGALTYFGDEHRLVEILVGHVSAMAGVEVQIGIADGLFAALAAARRSCVVEPGGSRRFLAPLPVTELDQPGSVLAEFDGCADLVADLVDLLRRLGLRTLGQFAELPERTVSSRFGRLGMLAHRLASGLSERPLDRRKPPAELAVEETFDVPVGTVEEAAYVAERMAGKLHAKLAGRNLACTRLGIYARTLSGEELSRVWRCGGTDGGTNGVPVAARGIADRVRWQFDSWLQGEQRPQSGVVTLRLEPEEVVEASLLQLHLWRGGAGDNPADDDADERAGRALVQVQRLLGPEAVVTAVLGGGRGPAERVRLVPWGEARGDEETLRRGAGAQQEVPTWPGRLPAPSPATVHPEPVRAAVVDRRGLPVRMTERGVLNAPPARVAVDGGPLREVTAWAGPWPLDERWWDPRAAGPAARIQVVVSEGPAAAGRALLLRCREQQSPRWQVEGEYT